MVRAFDPPADPYGPGHRGVDLAAEPGDPVFAAGAGTVVFAGVLAGRGVVSVDHPDGLRTTYEPLAVSVRAGAAVARGTLLGRLVAGHPGCPAAACLHWGLRRDKTYLDPLSLLRPRVVRLLPLTGELGSRPGVGLQISRAQPFHRDVRVDLRGREAGVTEDLLHGAQVGAAFEQVGRGGVAQPVRPQVGSARQLGQMLVHQPADRSGIDPPTLRAQDQRGTAAGPGQRGPPLPEPRVQRALGRSAERHGPLLVALADHPDHPPVPVDVIDIQTDSSPTRMPVAYSNSSTSRSRSPIGPSSDDGDSTSAPASSCRRIGGSVRCAFGLASSAPGSAASRPLR